ncbi:MAG: serine hydrolase [Leptospiraceae bacterium]|nr:serine hydrolase [Leptospiraceae bacterium]MCP5497415.1 serine hydrolase [Leptospiraceae bacterium]
MIKKLKLIPIFFILFLFPNKDSLYSQDHKGSHLQQVKSSLFSYLIGSINKGIVPGVSLSIYQSSSKVFDFNNGIDSKTGLGIASVTKPFTAFAILKLVEQNFVNLDEPISTYLKFNLENSKYKNNPITIRHLLQHTSCLPFRGSGKLYAINKREFYIPTQICKSGSKHIYSNSNYNLLLAIVETVTGNTYKNYVHKSIFGPLEMKNSNASRSNGAGGIISTSQDLAHFAEMMANEGVYKNRIILSRKLLSQMFQKPTYTEDVYSFYALGWRVKKNMEGQIDYVYHTGIWKDSLCEIRFFPKQKAYYVQLSNPKNYETKKINSYRKTVTELATHIVAVLNKMKPIAKLGLQNIQRL